MANTDRTQYKQVVAGTIGDLRTLSQSTVLASNGCVAQEAQRYIVRDITVAANTNANYCLARFDRPVNLLTVRLLPTAAVTTNGNTTLQLAYTNDNGGNLQNCIVITSNTTANGGFGNLVAFTSINLVTGTISNANVPSGSLLVLENFGPTLKEALPAGTAIQIIYEEV